MKRSKLITKVIVLAVIIYAGISLITLRGRVEAQRRALDDMKRRVAEIELSNAELEYELEHYNDPDVIANIARANLGLVLPGEIVFYNGGNVQGATD